MSDDDDFYDHMVDAGRVDMPVHAVPPVFSWQRTTYRCPLCKSESEYPQHTLSDCVLRLAERLDRIDANADPRSRLE